MTQPAGPQLVQPEVRPLANGALLSQRYEILALLGFGGMGAVYRAHDRELDRDVALKTIRNDLANDPAILQRFKHELVLARQVTHRNVIRIFDIGEAEGLKYITMEYLPGDDLAHVLRQRGKLPPAETADIIAQVCEGLAAAHAEGVIHRDLKPSNIMIGANGRVCVMDFGLARTSGDAGLTQTGALLGTVEYMSPEQARGEKLDVRSDIYSLGLIFYEMLTGEVPFKAESAVASLWKRMQARPTPVNTVDTTVPRALSGIVDRCLEVDREKRYTSANDILGELVRWDAKALSHSFPPHALITTGFSPLPTRRVPLVGWIAIAVVALAIAAGTYFGMRRAPVAAQAHAPVSVLVADFDNRTKDAVFDGTLEPAMTLALEGAPFISSYSRPDAHRIAAKIQPGTTTVDEALGRLVAVREGINVVVAGAIDASGSKTRVTVRALDASNGKVMVERSAESSKDAVLGTISDLASAVRKTLGDTTPESAQKAAAETFTSSSLEAAHEYAQAQDLQFAGKWDQASAHYRAALNLDPNMGRAYAGLAVMATNSGQNSVADENFKLALAHIDRMTDREKLRTRGSYYLFMREPQKAIDEYSALVKQFPADAAGSTNLALAYFYARDMKRAQEAGAQASALTPNAILPKSNLALFADYAGDYPAAAKTAREVLASNPQMVEPNIALAMAQVGQAQIADALQTYEKLKSVSARGAWTTLIGTADIAMYEGRFADARSMIERDLAANTTDKSTSRTAGKLVMLAEANLASGNKAAAIDAAQRAISTDKQTPTQYASGVVFANAGQPAKATTIADALARDVDPEPQMYGHLLRGEIALNNNSPAQAIDAFQQAQHIADSWLGHYGLGRAYLSANKFAEANSEFETCLKRRGESSAVFLDDVPSFRYFPPVSYYLARTQQGLNSPSAGDSFKTFLNMRKADDTLALDARRRMTMH
jgi:tetratricopeptide (TPR) repeat protein